MRGLGTMAIGRGPRRAGREGLPPRRWRAMHRACWALPACLAALQLAGRGAAGCTCTPKRTVADALLRAEAVFVGQVVSRQPAT